MARKEMPTSGWVESFLFGNAPYGFKIGPGETHTRNCRMKIEQVK